MVQAIIGYLKTLGINTPLGLIFAGVNFIFISTVFYLLMALVYCLPE